MSPTRETTVHYGENGNGRSIRSAVAKVLTPALAITIVGGLVAVGANLFTLGMKVGTEQTNRENLERTVKEKDAAVWTEIGKVWKNDEYLRGHREKEREEDRQELKALTSSMSDLRGDVRVIRNTLERGGR